MNVDKNHMLYLMLLGKVSEAKEMIKATSDLITNSLFGATNEFGDIDNLDKAIKYNLEAINANICGLSGMVEILDMIATVTKDNGYEGNANKLRHDVNDLVNKYEALRMAHASSLFVMFI